MVRHRTENGTDAFTTRRVGTAGHEIRDPDGNVVAWAVDEPWRKSSSPC